MSLPSDNVPKPIDPVPEGAPRPYWSVIIPAYNPTMAHLEEALQSVLTQDPGPEKMQIEVIDDCSPKADVSALVRQIAGERVRVHRNPVNRGMVACFNICLERSRGQWVHLLHQDDSILPGFYRSMEKSAELHPELALLASRSFYIDDESVVFGVSARVRSLENGGRAVDDFFYCTPIQCSGVVVRRSFYEVHGGFRSDLLFTLDCEMWARVIGLAGGMITSKALACYRASDVNETSRLIRTGKDLHDLERLNQIFAERYPAFDLRKARQRICDAALRQADRFLAKGDAEAAKINLDYWKSNVPASRRLRRFAGKIVRRFSK